ncbi:unnamed protein product [Ostreobium quekettii]|uniref:Transmembrane protein n=1 Tax=Ostreobium quekettii TaxID=121088 RepID=A0A8S1J1Z2_9CHLO|nr:unnamed protein product [Ostreobium quekettii]
MREAPLEFRAGAFCGGCLTRQQARDRCLQATRREVHKLTMSREFAEWYTNKQTSAIVTWWCAFALGLLVIAASTAAAGVLYLWVRDTQKVLADTQGKALLVPAPETAPLPDTEMATDANAKLGETATGDERKGPSCDWDPYDVGEMYESARPEDNLLSNEGCGYASVDQRQHANDLRMEEPIWEDCARSLKQQDHTTPKVEKDPCYSR